ncbi:MAG: hypothetical protein WCA49_21830 [Candidatus Sulfotelmatobacter sp.]
MRIEIEIPPKDMLLADLCEVPIAHKGVAWSGRCLGKLEKANGVYVIQHDGRIMYVGKTNSPGMSFGTRLRREFSEGASAGRHIYPALAPLIVPPPIFVTCISSASIMKMVRCHDLSLGSYEAVEIMEAVLIQAFKPRLQPHQEKVTRRALRKNRISEATLEKMMEVGFPRDR